VKLFTRNIVLDEWAGTPLARKPMTPIATTQTKMTITNINELRAVLCDTISAARANEITPDSAEAVSNAAGKIVGSLRVELEYRRMRNEVPQLAFMEGAK